MSENLTSPNPTLAAIVAELGTGGTQPRLRRRQWAELFAMAGLLVGPRKRDSQSTSLNQRYPGGSLRIIGANSPSGFQSSSAPVVFQDEIDGFSREGCRRVASSNGRVARSTAKESVVHKTNTRNANLKAAPKFWCGLNELPAGHFSTGRWSGVTCPKCLEAGEKELR